MLYIGFDLGDGETCLSYSEENNPPIELPVTGDKSVISAVAVLDGKIVVGRAALGDKAQNTRVCFKRHFLEGSADCERAIVDFVKGVLEDVRNSGIPNVSEFIDDPEKVCFVVGCPAGWNADARERYKRLLTDGGMKNVRLTSESRAAFESFATDEAFKVDRKLFNQSVLVIDIGSSTLDFSYVLNGNEQEVEILGNTLLGGGMMDEMLLLNSVNMIPDMQTRRTVLNALEQNPAAKSKLMVATRRMKENYFTNEDEYLVENRDYTQQALVVADRQVLRFNLHISPDIVENFVKSYPHPLLNNQTFENRLRNSLSLVKSKLKEHGDPALVILTGGPSRMRFFQDICSESFPKSRVVVSENPESDISQGLCRLGYMDSGFGQFLAEVTEFVNGSSVEDCVSEALPQLIDSLSESMTDALYRDCVIPDLDSWKEGKISTLNELKSQMGHKMELYMSSRTMKQEVRIRTESWAAELLPSIQENIEEIAEKHGVRHNPLCIAGVSVEAPGSVHGPDEPVDFGNFELIIAAITATVCGVVCGGTGMALLMAGPLGFALGAVIGLVAVIIGSVKAEEYIMSADLPMFFRKLIRTGKITSPEEKAKVKKSISDSFMQDKTLTDSLTTQIGAAIDQSIQSLIQKTEQQM